MEQAVLRVMRECKASRAEAEEMLRNTQNDVDKAIAALNSRKQPHAIVKYKNGLLVDGTFYSYSDRSNIELRNMLDRNEFDRSIFRMGNAGTGGDADEFADVTVENKEMEDYRDADSVKRIRKDEGELRKEMEDLSIGAKTRKLDFMNQGVKADLKLPENIVIGENGTVRSKLSNNHRISTLQLADSLSIGDVVDYIYRIAGVKVKLLKMGEVLDEMESVTVINRCFIEIFI